MSEGLAASLGDGELARTIHGAPPGSATAAESALCARFSRRVYLYGLRHLGDDARAEDLAQDVMARVIERLRAGEVREPERIGSFILGTARWMTRDVRVRERRASEVAEAAAREMDLALEPREPIDAGALGEALAALSERERAVIVLTFQDDASATEIAASLGIEPGHVRVIRHRAIARLASRLGLGSGEEGS